MKKEYNMTAGKYAYAFIALGICAASLGATTAQAAEAAASSPAQTETTAPIALAPVTISDHGETLTMLLPQLPAFQKEEQSFPAIGFSISKYTARAEAAGLDVLVQHSVFADDGTAPPTLDEAVAGARDAIAAAYQPDRMMRNERIDLGGVPAHLFSYSYTVNGASYIDDSIVVAIGFNQWNITLARRADNTAVAPRIDELLTSIRVQADKAE
ncbi:hypothetical protein HMPREF9555_00773 [Selenomonas artemidis F0399]|uniref:Lipoprotein n=2 Tax=Selenomonas TaxID=970 RepID=E7N1C0_9FIRM|nr:hypothetical protein HMPREF9555_00773 [Selenomonas artemidis F0399]